ncbi:hypothetical protein D9M69_188590 [compost metagenome]
MVRLRKLVQAIAAASALTTGMAHALGLGDIHLNSALNQPLDAEIDLLEVRDLSSGEVVSKLASPEEFNRAGVDRQYFLTGLRFTPVIKPNGRSVIRVTSDRPVQEPYLNFLVEVLWPSGRLLREYTVLLDPPLYSPQVAAAVPRAPVAMPAPAPAPRSAAVAPRPAPPAPSSAPSQSQPALAGGQYRVGPRDTLWEIASRARPDGSVTVHQTMLAIQDLNPDAFLGGNINRLKSGQVLRLPDEQQVRTRSQNQALAQVAEQNAAWREGRNLPVGGARQLDATQRTSAGAAPAETQVQDSLRLVSGEPGNAKQGGAEKGSQRGKAIADELAITQESLDTTRRENDELQDRMKDLQSQLDKLQKLIQLKDAQLAKLQADLGEGGQAPASSADAPAQAEPDQAAAQAPAGEASVPGAPESAAAPAAEAPAAQPAPVESAQPAAGAQEPAKAPAAKPAPAATEPTENSLLDEILANPVWLGAIAGSTLLVLLVLLMVLSRRNAAKQSEQAQDRAATSEPAQDDDLNLGNGNLEGWEVSAASEQPAAVQPVAAERASQTTDALGEADIYIAYGRFNQAAELLQGAIYDEPERTDLRLKLMEVYAEIGDREGFARQENDLREMGGVDSEVEQLKSRYPGMATLAAVGGGLAAAAAVAASSDDLDSFSLDDLQLDEAELVEPVIQPPAADTGLDDAFDLALDDLEFDQPESDKPVAAENDSLGLEEFDLGADFETEKELPKTDEEFSFDLELPADVSSRPEPLVAGDDLDEFSLDLGSETASTDAATAGSEDDFLLDLGDDAATLLASDEAFVFGPEAEAAIPSADELPEDFDLSLAGDIEPAAERDSFAAQLDELGVDLSEPAEGLDAPQAEFSAGEGAQAESSLEDEDDDFDFLSGADEAATKLDLARAYIDMGDAEGARDILDEVIAEGNDDQQQEARELLGRIA